LIAQRKNLTGTFAWQDILHAGEMIKAKTIQYLNVS